MDEGTGGLRQTAISKNCRCATRFCGDLRKFRVRVRPSAAFGRAAICFLSAPRARRAGFQALRARRFDGAERLLIDPNKVKADGKRYSIGDRGSFAGRQIRFLLICCRAAQENGELRVVEVDNRARFGRSASIRVESATRALAAGRQIVSLQPACKNCRRMRRTTRKVSKQAVYLHTSAQTRSSRTRPVFGNESNPGNQNRPDDRVDVMRQARLEICTGESLSGVRRTSEYLLRAA